MIRNKFAKRRNNSTSGSEKGLVPSTHLRGICKDTRAYKTRPDEYAAWCKKVGNGTNNINKTGL